MFRIQHNKHASGRDALRQGRAHLHANSFLNLRARRDNLEDTGETPQTDNDC